MELRLQKARNLLMQTDMSVINVALASGSPRRRISRNAIAPDTMRSPLPRTRQPRRKDGSLSDAEALLFIPRAPA